MRPNEYPRVDTPAEDDVLLIDSDEYGTRSISVEQVKGTTIPNPLPVDMGGTGNTSVDTSPVNGSTNMITSGGVYNALKNGSGLTGVIPVSKGGTGNSSVDTTPTSESTKMVTSGGLFKALYGNPLTELEFKSFPNSPLGIRGLVYGNGILLAYGARNGYSYALYSINNGKTWVSAYNSEVYNYTWYDTYGYRAGVYGKNRFVLGGFTSKSVCSEDGLTWQECKNTDITTSTYTYLQLSSIAFSGSYFVAIDERRYDGYAVVRSTDGINWSAVKNDIFKNIQKSTKVLYGNGKFIIICPIYISNKWYINIYYSTTGTTWYTYAQCIDCGTNQPNIGTVCYGNGKYILGIYRDSKEFFYYSTDASTWHLMSGAPFTSSGDNYMHSYNTNSMSYCNGIFIYVGQTGSGLYYYSTDAIYWASASLDFEKNYALCPMIYANGTTIAGTLTGYSSSETTGLTVYSNSYKPI